MTLIPCCKCNRKAFFVCYTHQGKALRETHCVPLLSERPFLPLSVQLFILVGNYHTDRREETLLSKHKWDFFPGRGRRKEGAFSPSRARGGESEATFHAFRILKVSLRSSLSLSLVLCLQPKEKDMKQRKPQKKRFAGSLMIAGASEKDSSAWERKSFLTFNIISAIAS